MNELRNKLIAAAITVLISVGTAAITMEKKVAASDVRVAGMETRLSDLEHSAVRREEQFRFERELDQRLKDLSIDVRDIKRVLLSRAIH